MTSGARIRCIDLFCGAGGSSCGARTAGAVPVVAIDSWPLAAKAYERNFPTARVYTADIRKTAPRKLEIGDGQIDLLLASPECTNHSPAKGNAPRCEASRRTAFEVLRYLAYLRPRWVVVENVVSMQRWAEFPAWLRDLENLGYYTKVLKLDAAVYGVPQTRRRLFVIGDLQQPPNTPKPGRGRALAARSIIHELDSSGNAWRFSRLEDPRRAPATMERARTAFSQVGRRTPFLLVYYGTDGAGGWQPLDRPLRTITTLDRFALVVPNGRGHLMRMLQPPELAEAMGFPRTYKWPESTRRDRIKLIGNAVCPPVMKRVVQALTQIPKGSRARR